MSTTTSRFLSHAGPAAIPGLCRAACRTVLAVLSRVELMLRMARSRRMLAEADDRTLADLGISRAQARFVAARRSWDWRGLSG